MCNRINKNIIFLFSAIVFCSTPIQINYAQQQELSYSVNAYFSLGYGKFLSELDYDKLNKSGFSGTIIIMWEPEHLLSIGIESGYLQLYNLDNQQVGEPPNTFGITSSLNAVPIIAVFSMKIIDNFKLSGGSGMFILYSRVDAINNPVISSQLSTGSYIAANYLHPLSDLIALGGEIKFYYINKIEDGELTLQISLQYKFLSY